MTLHRQAPLILLVDDEPLIRMTAADMLEDAGFRTIEASSADEAIRILEERMDVALVMTDIQMPGSMDGLKLAAAVQRRWPPVRLIVTSGRFRPEADELPPGAAFVPKPYDSHTIHTHIRQLLA